ncbi:MAG: ABC transporter substrate binding protein, partial [Hylemonella sp.]
KSSRFAALMLKNQAMNGAMVEAMQSVAKSLRIELHDFYYEKSDDIPQIFAAFVKQKIRGLIVQENPVIGAYLKEVVQLTLKHRIPSIGFGSYADVGAPLAYGVDLKVFARRAGYFVNRILKGEKPGDIPFERATRFEMIINQKAVKTLGMTISPAINVQATRIID